MRKIIILIILFQFKMSCEDIKKLDCIEPINNELNQSTFSIKRYIVSPEEHKFLLKNQPQIDENFDYYDTIEILDPDYSHFYHEVNKECVEEIFTKNTISTVVEIGSWTGAGSTKHLAELLKMDNKGKLYAVDTWLGSIEHQEGQMLYSPVLKNLYQQFLSNIIHFDLTEFIIPCKMTSLEAAEKLNVSPDLLYLDGDHSTESVYNDLKAWYPLMKENGIICGDDWGWESVNIAVKLFAKEYDLQIEARDNFWRFYKEDSRKE